MNSSILVSGFVVVGVGAMAILFNPFGSSEDTSSTPASTYQASTDVASNGLKASAEKVSAPSPVVATSSDPEPFVWENKKKPVASTGILNDLSQSTSKKIAKSTTAKSTTAKTAKSTTEKARKSPFGQRSLGSKDSTPKTQPVSKTSPDFVDQEFSTVENDLDSFFGTSKSTKPATKVAKAPKTKPAVTKVDLSLIHI